MAFLTTKVRTEINATSTQRATIIMAINVFHVLSWYPFQPYKCTQSQHKIFLREEKYPSSKYDFTKTAADVLHYSH
jgi:hypothetical protein